MANVKNFRRFSMTALEKSVVLNQSFSIPLYNDLVDLAKEKNLDSVQALTRFVMADFNRKYGKKKAS